MSFLGELTEGRQRIGIEVEVGVVAKIETDGLPLVEQQRLDDFALGGPGTAQNAILQLQRHLVGRRARKPARRHINFERKQLLGREVEIAGDVETQVCVRPPWSWYLSTVAEGLLPCACGLAKAVSITQPSPTQLPMLPLPSKSSVRNWAWAGRVLSRMRERKMRMGRRFRMLWEMEEDGMR
jgi:hypothetical protein